LQDLGLRKPALDLDRADHLGELRPERALRPRLEEAGDLHGERRAARDDMPAPQGLPCRTRKRPWIDATMLVEALVLIGEEHLQKPRIDLGGRRRQAPYTLRSGEWTQEPPLPVDHQHRMGKRRAERRRAQSPHRLGQAETDRIRSDQCAEERSAEKAEAAAAHGRIYFPFTVTAPASSRALMSGRYMSSTLAPGWA
jgi:hypothetical protein